MFYRRDIKYDIEYENKHTLKPCPFCGAKAKMRLGSFSSGGFGEGGYDDWVISCTQCKCKMKLAADCWYGREYYTEEQAAEIWNKRTREINPISYTDCANAMMMMWIDKVVTNGEYNRIMDKLNAKYKEDNNG